MSIESLIKERNIKSLIHFTRIENLENILNKGIVSRNSIGEDGFKNVWDDFFEVENNKQKYLYNDDLRLDNKKDYSCFSISFPNNEMLYRLRKNNENSHWAILILSSNILLNYDCLFYPCNAASNSVRHEDIESFKGEVALENMFYSEGRDSYLTNKYPTDVQAEVLIKGIISPEYIVFVFLDNESLVNQYKEKYPNYKFLYCKKDTKVFNTRKAFIHGY